MAERIPPYLKLRDKSRTRSRVEVDPAQKSFWSRLAEWLLAGGALISVLSWSADSYIKIAQQDSDVKIASCKTASDILMDDKANEQLTPEQANQMINWSLKTLQNCGRRDQ